MPGFPGITTGLIDNQQSSSDNYRNENPANNPISSMVPNGWFIGAALGIPGAAAGIGEATVYSLPGYIQQMVEDMLNNENDDDEDDDEEKK